MKRSDLSPHMPPGRGIIGESRADGRRVVWNFVNEWPDRALRAALPCLIVLRWAYDGAVGDGMPDEAAQASIFRLDQRLWSLEEAPDTHRAYSRTGNDLREWVFYAASTEVFMTRLNHVLAGEERYPLDIRFYDDPTWTDLRGLLKDFGQMPEDDES